MPDDRLVIAESGVRSAETIARWRAQGFDGALVGEALVRSGDPAATVRSFVAAGAAPTDPANVARRPLVKICGIGDAGSAIAAISAGADAVGLNLVPGTPRALSLDEAADLARTIRTATAAADRPTIVAITADAAVADLAAIVATVDPDVVQLNGREPVSIVASIGRPVWKVLHLPAEPPPDVPSAAARLAASGRAYLAGGVERLLLDTAGGPHPGGTGQRASVALAAAVAREVPVTLAGGLAPGERRRRAARHRGDRRGRRLGRGAAARARGAAAQGPVPRRPLRQARPCRARRPPQPGLRPDAGPRRPARGRRATAAGGWSATSAAGTCPRR